MEKITSINIKSIVAKINEIIEVITSIPDKYDDTKLRNDINKRISALENRPEPPKVEKYDDSTLLGKLAEIEKSIESLDKRTDYLKRTYSEKWAMQQIEVDKVKSLRGEIYNKIDEVKSNFACSCDAQSALKVADYTRRTMTEKYTEQQFQINKIKAMIRK